MPLIGYESLDFKQNMVSFFERKNPLRFTWRDLIHSAITVGCKNWTHVIRFGNYSKFEILYRLAIICANLKELDCQNLGKTQSYINLDPIREISNILFFGANHC